MKLFQMVALAIMLSIGATAQAADQIATRYVLDASGNLVEQQYMVPDNSDRTWKTVGIVALSLLGIAGAVWLVNEWSEDDDPQPVQQPSNGLVPTAGSSTQTWQTDFLVPTYVPVQ